MTLQFSSLQKTISYSNVQAVFLPAYFGQAEILPDHAEAFFALQPGQIILKQENSSKEITISQSALAYINNNHLIIIA